MSDFQSYQFQVMFDEANCLPYDNRISVIFSAFLIPETFLMDYVFFLNRL